MTQQVRGVIFDVDGTLIDSNMANARAWVEAMHEQGYDVSVDKVGPLIGMGGDKVLPEVLGIEKDSEQGKKISQRRKAILKDRYMPDLKAFPGALELLQHLHDLGLKLVVATSADQDEADRLLKIVGPNVPDLFAHEVTSKQAKQSKPNPEVMEVALQQMGFPPDNVMMIGDTVYDIEAAAKVSVHAIAFRSGGWKDSDLRQAVAIYDGPADLLAHYNESPLAR